jgi:hypothetical protein
MLCTLYRKLAQFVIGLELKWVVDQDFVVTLWSSLEYFFPLSYFNMNSIIILILIINRLNTTT